MIQALLRSSLLLLFPMLAPAQGMWLPIHLEKQNEKEMKAMGCKLDADDIYSAAQPSIKDAICQFGGGCTAEIISPEALVLTNHHCGFDAVQNLSSLENNYIDNGFWAKSKQEELPCPGLTVMFVSRMEDVTALALQGVVDGMSERDRQSVIDKNLAQIKATTRKEKWEEILFRPFYAGNQYFMFVTLTYKDVRLVGTPPSSIGKFGSDTDNWVWPRHTGDFSLFRVYAGADNQPADYSKDNVPLKPKHFLPISIAGLNEGDFTMVYGFPGRTDEYLPAIALQQTAEVLNPARVALRDKALKIMDGLMRANPDYKIAYVSRYVSIANAWKKWQGEMLGLKTYKAVDKKTAYEAEFTRRISNNIDWNYRYKNILPRLEETYKAFEPYALARDYYLEACVRNNEILGEAAALHTWVKTYDENGETFFASKLKDNKASLESFYKDYRPQVDQAVFAGLMELYGTNANPDFGGRFVQTEAAKHNGYAGLAAYIFANSYIADKDKMMALLSEKPAVIAQKLKADPAYVFWKTLSDAYQSQVQPKVQELQPQINLLQRQYMAAQMAVFKEKRFFPDANSTLRLTYGKVKSYRPKDALIYDHHTYLDGVMEKYIPGDYEFDVPQKLIELYKSKDYGPYAAADGRMPVAFIGTNHTTGGNSGSPALDARGNLVGLNFDRVWEGTMSDLNYDAAICRNIMVDARYILFIIDKFAGAKNIIDELKIVKKKK